MYKIPSPIIYMNLEVIRFTNKNGQIYKKYICEKQNGNSIPPSIKWSKIDGAKSYALIMEDPDASVGIFVHWYIPFIDESLNEITGSNQLNKNHRNPQQKIKIFQGKNSIDEFGYHGPCAPDGTGIHRYIFKLYAFNIKFLIDNDMIKIKSAKDFIIRLKKKYPLIKILAKDTKTFNYKYKNYNSSSSSSS